MRLSSLVCALSAGVCLASGARGQDVDARYPNRIPDWLWDDPAYGHLLSAQDVLTIRGDIAKLAEFVKLEDSHAADSLEADIAKRLASKFSVRDFYPGAYVANNPAAGISIALRLDPAFDATAKRTLESAVSRLIEVAFDTAVIAKAFRRSTATPPPMPPVFAMKDGKPITDDLGRPIITSGHSLYLRSRSRPPSPTAFLRHLRSVFSGPDGDPALLVVSSYTGNVWWGGSLYSFFSDPSQQLSRAAPARGYLYVRLNTEKLSAPQTGWNDPDFWASKLAHELLHNLGYWHPAYKDPDEREAGNRGNDWAFIVSYEQAIYEKLKAH